MKTSGETESVSMPSSLLAEVQAAANEEHRTREELLLEAVERYLRDRSWQRLLSYGEERARSLGLTDADVPRLIEEYRQERSIR
jgi:metal-responsive CopG/Arc/MetJ family transcriptional regulator